MAEATLSSKYQVTLPMEIVRALGLKGGDKLIVHLSGDHVVIMPKPGNWAEYWMGRLKGVYGNTKEEVDQYLYEVRHGGAIGATTLEDLLAKRGSAWLVLHSILGNGNAMSHDKLHKAWKGPDRELNTALDELKKLGAIREVPQEAKKGGFGALYRSTEAGRQLAEIYRKNRE